MTMTNFTCVVTEIFRILCMQVCACLYGYIYIRLCVYVYSELEHDRTLVKPARISWLWPKCQVHMPILQAPRAREQICISVTRSPVRCKNKNTSHLTPSSYQEDHRAHTHTRTHRCFYTCEFNRFTVLERRRCIINITSFISS